MPIRRKSPKGPKRPFLRLLGLYQLSDSGHGVSAKRTRQPHPELPCPAAKYNLFYSLRNDLTGFIRAALMLWKEIVSKVTTKAPSPDPAKIHHDSSVRYS